MNRKVAGLIFVLVVGELAVFYWENRDVVLLNQSTEALVLDARFPDAARSVLARERVSRRVLERVADVARQRHELELHVDALERIVASAPDDAEARLRLAQALREAGRLEEAERIYREQLDGTDEGGER
jgi:thioredoxin-like negative regulator of GroEL